MSHYAFDVFLSYASDDRKFARQMVRWLRSCGLRVWIDEEQLVPGSRFRVGLQQGLQESRHMVALLTDTYSTRHWTQRELDLFDLDADHSERRVFGIELAASLAEPLDQMLQVHQRVKWCNPGFDPEAFWKLHCGLTNSRPGSRENWIENGKRLIQSTPSDTPVEKANESVFTDSVSRHSTGVDLIALVQTILESGSGRWESGFHELQRLIANLPFEQLRQDLISTPWAVGFSEFAAVVAMAALPKKHRYYSAWPFLDLSCPEIITWFLMKDALEATGASEIWFSWAVCQQAWDALPTAAARAPFIISDHFAVLAKPAVSADIPFEKFEHDYDYGMMITPWNHFHLSWLAGRLGDQDASRAHASKLCSTTTLGDVRTGRFVNRLTTWSIFASLREDQHLRANIRDARRALGMIEFDKIPAVQSRLADIWLHVQKRIGYRDRDGHR